MRAFMKSRDLPYWHILLIAALFAVGALGQSIFVAACAGCAAIFWAVQFRLLVITRKEESVQKKQCKPIGYLLLLPTSGMLTIGIIIFFGDYIGEAAQQSYIAIGTAILLVGIAALPIISGWQEQSPAGKFARQTAFAGLSAPMAVLVVLILHLTGADGDRMLSCMSAVLFAVVSLLLSANMILVSSCGYRSTWDSIKAIRRRVKEHRLVFTRVSILKDGFLVMGKASLAIVSASFFMFVNALYSTGVGAARLIALKMHGQERKKQIASYCRVGIIITTASICYVLYSLRLFFGGQTGEYSMNVALVIALYTFVEFGINIRDAIRLRGSSELEAKALKAISFSATLLCFVLTQTAIMSFAAEGDNHIANALSGIVFGALASLRGFFVILDSRRHKRLLA